MSQSVSKRPRAHGLLHPAPRCGASRPCFGPGSSTVLVGVLRGLGCRPIRTGVAEDHVHLLFAIGRITSLSAVANALKNGPRRSGCADRHLLFRASTGREGSRRSRSSPAGSRPWCANIEDQDRHHGHRTFEDELRRWFDEYGIRLDERYAWD